ncbi:hypothetical protein [Limimaricola pyoseonensis]|uniref:Uncharacterized protein n=1 Tax=Limimaricola pyoseonensis TaxID=521013 RepID=A0A1G7DJQ8_9RHOB|nr:hypothetical protein [Limimaricola pyoseonensis]SDE51326.1 hypothetical protein SAMN04488567_1957 [Limimaricola pyoseonensis]
MFRRSMVAAALAAVTLAAPAAAQQCQMLRFPAGYTVGHVKGQASGDEVACYLLDIPVQQNFSVVVVEGRGMITAAPGGWDATDQRMYVGWGEDRVRPFRLHVGPLMRAPMSPFTLEIRFEAPGNG